MSPTLITSRRMIVPVFFLALFCSCGLAKSDGPTFNEGAVNTTLAPDLIVGSNAVLRCTVNESDPEVVELNMLPLPSLEDNWNIIHDVNETKWVEVVITKVSHKNAVNFTCFANNNKTVSFLTYELSVYNGTTFNEGTNTTVVPELIVGSDATLRCTVNKSDPEVVELDMLPPPSPGENWKISHDETSKKWVEVVITKVSHKNAMNFTCFANNSETISFLTYELSVYNGTTFKEGTNTTIASQIVNGYNSTFRCTVDKSDPPVVELSILPLPGPEDNWKIKTNGTEWIEVIITKASNMTSKKFDCLARNNVTTSFLTYELSLVDSDGPHFVEGDGNTTLWSEIMTGSNASLTCTIKASVPPVTELGAVPPGEPGTNWEVKKNGTYSIEVVITEADSSNRMDYICTAYNGIQTSVLVYENFVGGPPNAVQADIEYKVEGDDVIFSITVSDKSEAPAREILIHVEGATGDNISLQIPNPLTNGKKYTFHDIKIESNQESKKHLLHIYAKNTLGVVHVQDYTYYITKKPKGSSDAGKIAAGILVPILLIIVGIVIGGVVFYFWRKKMSRKDFKPLSSPDVDDASKGYGAL